MNDLALLAIGIGLGLALALVAVMVYVLFRAAQQMRQSASQMLALSQRVEGAANGLRAEVTLALSRLDADRLYTASLSLNRLVKSLSLQIDTLQRVIFTQPAGPALDFTQAGMTGGVAGTGIDEEAEDDARMLREAGRWQQPLANQPLADPLAGLSEDEKRRRVLEYFERKRAVEAGFPSLPLPPPIPFLASSLPPPPHRLRVLESTRPSSTKPAERRSLPPSRPISQVWNRKRG